MEDIAIRQIETSDYDVISPLIDDWWGGRPVRALLPRLFFEHFSSTSFVAGSVGTVTAFLIGFRSQSVPSIAYIHFVGVHPEMRGQGLGRRLYEHFFRVVRSLACAEVQCITSPQNLDSIAFHRRMGFDLLPGTGVVNGFPVVLDHAGPGQHRVLFRRSLFSEDAGT